MNSLRAAQLISFLFLIELPAGEAMKEEEFGQKNPPQVCNPANYSKLEVARVFRMAIDEVPMIYYADEIGMTAASHPDNGRDMPFGDQVSADEPRMLQNFEKLEAVRCGHPVLHYRSRRTARADQNGYALVRAYQDERVVVASNRGNTEAKLELDVAPQLAGDYVEALTGNKLRVEAGKVRFSLAVQTAAFVTIWR